MNDLLQAELSPFLGYEPYEKVGYNSGNSRNGTYSRKFETKYGTVQLTIPRERNGNFSPVPSFAFSETTYPGATDPKLEGKPVMVLAVKGENPDSCTYSFLSMAALVDTYKAKATGKDKSTTVTIADYEVDVKVNVSAAAGNALVLKDDGMYVPTPKEVDISGKADKATGATTGNFAALDGEGNLTDSGKKPADFVAAETGKRLMTDAEGEKLAGVSEGATKTAASSTNGNVNIDGKEVVVYTEPENVLHDEDVEDFSAEEIAALLAD